MFLLPGARLGSKLAPNKRPSSQLQTPIPANQPIEINAAPHFHLVKLLSKLFHDTKDIPIQSGKELYVHNSMFPR
jgi:hypothetical protein